VLKFGSLESKLSVEMLIAFEIYIPLAARRTGQHLRKRLRSNHQYRQTEQGSELVERVRAIFITHWTSS